MWCDRQRDAADRVRARKEREEEELKAEVAQFGEEEARRRLRKERELKKQIDQLTTSDAEEMEVEDQVANPMLDISAVLRADKKLEWSTSLGTKALDTFKIESFEQQLYEEVQKSDGFTKGWPFTRFLVVVKASHSRATRVIQSIDDLSETEWAKAVDVIKQQSGKWAPQLTVKFEVYAEVDRSVQQASSRRPAVGDSDTAEMPTGGDRMTRTDYLLNEAREQDDTLAGRIE